MTRCCSVRLLAAFAAALFLAPAVLAEAEGKNKKDAKGNPDQEFVTKASQDGLAEVNHGDLAFRKASNPEVKEFARRMVKDHMAANRELTNVANNKQFRLARDMGKKHQDMQDKLAKLRGEEFDREYMKHMVMGHKEAVSLFEKEAKNGKDEELKAFAEKTLPTLREHFKLAQSVAGKVGAGGEDAEKAGTGKGGSKRSDSDRSKSNK